MLVFGRVSWRKRGGILSAYCAGFLIALVHRVLRILRHKWTKFGVLVHILFTIVPFLAVSLQKID